MNCSDADFELAKIRFKKLYKKAKELNISDSDLQSFSFVKKHKINKVNVFCILSKWIAAASIIVILFGGAIYGATNKGYIEAKLIAEWTSLFTGADLQTDNCIIPFSEYILDFLRPPVNCEFCRDVKGFDRVKNLSQDDFVKIYAYSGRPVIVTDATLNWTASQQFSFDFFKKLYKKNSPVFNDDSSNRDCQFFPYKTNFNGLYDVFKMSKHMKDMRGDPWYVGW